MVKEENKTTSTGNSMHSATLGIQLAAGMVVFTLIGNWIDQKVGKGYTWILVGMFLGIFYCGYEIWKLARQNNDNEGEV